MSYDKKDVEYISQDLYRNLQVAEHQAEGLIEAVKFINRSQGKTYNLTYYKELLEAVKKAKEIL